MKSNYLLLLFLLPLIHCKSSKKVHDTSEEDNKQLELSGVYFVKTLYSEDISNYELTIIFDSTKKRISGFSGCNSYNCSYQLDGNFLKTTFPLATKRYSNETSGLEKRFFKVLSEEKFVNLSADTLEIKNNLNKTILLATKSAATTH